MDNKHKPIIGIDLGTTNSVVSYPVKKEKGIDVEFIKINGDHLVPSFIYVGKGNKYVVGKKAKEKTNTDPERVLSSYKPYIGDDRILKEIDGVGYNSFTATSIALKYIKAGIDKKFPDGIDGVVITVPAYFTENQKSDTTRAAKHAGLEVKGIITEPSASAFSYIETHDMGEEGKTVLVYDIGGGTFDVSIVYLTNEGFATVIGIGGDQYLGGDDFDELLADYIEKKYYPRSNFSINNKQILIRACERIKIEMMNDGVTDKVYDIDVSAIDTSVEIQPTITYKEFKEITKPLVDNTLRIVHDVLVNAGLDIKTDIDNILLVGGSSRLLNIREALDEATEGKFNLQQKDPYLVEPDYSVSWGASVYAQLIMDKETDKVTDILSKNLGIADNKGKMLIVLEKGLPIPATGSRAITNPLDDQDKLEIGVYEGVSENVLNNTLIGNMEINLPEGLKKHELEATVKFKINSDGILEVFIMGDYEDKLTISLNRSYYESEKSDTESIDSAQFESDISSAGVEEDNKEKDNPDEEDKDSIDSLSWGKLL